MLSHVTKDASIQTAPPRRPRDCLGLHATGGAVFDTYTVLHINLPCWQLMCLVGWSMITWIVVKDAQHARGAAAGAAKCPTSHSHTHGLPHSLNAATTVFPFLLLSCVCVYRCCPSSAPRGFNPVQDLNDNYQFLYPFGWQEVGVKGADVVYKDVVEPLESVSVTITPTDKKDITEFGAIEDVSKQAF